MAIKGIYRIWIGDRYYWGRSKNVEKRIHEHIKRLCENKHRNPKMQNAFNATGRVRGQLVKVIDDDVTLMQYESAIIARHFDDKRCLNLRMERGDGSCIHSDETRRKFSQMRKGRKLSPTHRENVVAALRGRKLSEETRRKISQAHLGKYVSEETRRKIGLASKGRANRRKPVVMSSKGGEFYFRSADAAAAYIGCAASNLRSQLAGRAPWSAKPGSKHYGWRGHYLNTEELQSAY